MAKEKPRYKTPEEILKQINERGDKDVPMREVEKLIEKAVKKPSSKPGKK